jgi:hypothetical protein
VEKMKKLRLRNPKIVIVAILIVSGLFIASYNNLGINLGMLGGGNTTGWPEWLGHVTTEFYEERYYDATTNQEIDEWVQGCLTKSDASNSMPLVADIRGVGSGRRDVIVNHGYPNTGDVDKVPGNEPLNNKGGIYCIDADSMTVAWSYRGENIGGHAQTSLHDLDGDGKLELLVCGYKTMFVLEAETGQLMNGFTPITSEDYRMDHAPLVLKDGFDVYIYIVRSSHGSTAETAGVLKLGKASNGNWNVVSFSSEPFSFIGNGGLSSADINNDGLIEILLGDKNYSNGHGVGLICFDTDLNTLWKVDGLNCQSQAPLIIPDVSNPPNGGYDILVQQQNYLSTTTYRRFVIYDGHVESEPEVLGWSPISMYERLPETFGSGSVCDIDRDFHLEYLYAANSHIMVYDLGYPSVSITLQNNIANPDGGGNFATSPIVANVLDMGVERDEFVEVTTANPYGIYAFYYDNSGSLQYTFIERPNQNYYARKTSCMTITNLHGAKENNIVQVIHHDYASEGRYTEATVQILWQTQAYNIEYPVKDQGYSYLRNNVANFTVYEDPETTSRQSPRAYFTYTEGVGDVAVSALLSHPSPGTTITGYNWDWGDGTYYPAFEEFSPLYVAYHQYVGGGFRTITLTVKNNLGYSSRYSLTDWFPLYEKSLFVISPQNREMYNVGDDIQIKWYSEGNIPKVYVAIEGKFSGDYPRGEYFYDDIVNNQEGENTLTIKASKYMAKCCSYFNLIYGPQYEPKLFLTVVEADSEGNFGYWIQDQMKWQNYLDDTGDKPFGVTDVVSTKPFGWIFGNGDEVLQDGDTWQAGTQHNLEWTHYYSGNAVDISLWRNDGGSWVFDSNLFTQTTNDGVQPWTIPTNQPPGYYKIYIHEPYTQATSYTSGSGFEITNQGTGQITVNTPNGAEKWDYGSTKNIQYSCSQAMNVNIYIYNMISDTYITVTTNHASVSGSNTVPVTLNDEDESVSGPHYKVKVERTGQTTQFDWSNSPFTIQSIYLLDPNGGESWQCQSSQHILCDTYFDEPGITFDLYKGGTSESNKILNNLQAQPYAEGDYVWYIPSLTEGSDYYMKMETSDYDYDFCDGPFTITTSSSPQITIQLPTSSSIWVKGTNGEVKYTSNAVGTVSIKLYHSDPTEYEYTQQCVVGTNTFQFPVPTGVPSGGGYQIEVWHHSGSHGVFSQPFTITDASAPITITYPSDAGITWTIGQQYDITWTENIDSTVVNIALFKGNTAKDTKSMVPNSGTYHYTVPNVSAGNDYKINIYDPYHSNIQDWSDNPFTISGTQSVTITVPKQDGTTVWNRNPLIGQPVVNRITYTYTGTLSWDYVTPYLVYPDGTQVDLSGSLGNGWVDVSISHNTPTGPGYKIKLYFVVEDIYATSATFSVAASGNVDLYIITPNVYQYYQVGSTVQLKWGATFSGTLNVFLVEGNSNSPVSSIATGLSNSKGGSYSWKIPTTVKSGSQYKIKVQDPKNPAYFDTSDFYFQVGTTSAPPKLEINEPSGSTPGFELIPLIAGIAICLIILRRKKI